MLNKVIQSPAETGADGPDGLTTAVFLAVCPPGIEPFVCMCKKSTYLHSHMNVCWQVYLHS